MNLYPFSTEDDLDRAGIVPYTIDPLGGFFKSLGTYPTRVVEVMPNMPIPTYGDCLLRVICDRGEAILSFGDATEPILQGQSISLFGGGLPITGQCSPPFVATTEYGARVWAIFESYGRTWRNTLKDKGAGEWGVAVRLDAHRSYRVRGREGALSKPSLVPMFDAAGQPTEAAHVF